MESSSKTIKDLLAKKDAKALEAHLKQGMAAYLDSDTYKKFLAFSALFHNILPKIGILFLAKTKMHNLLPALKNGKN